MSRYFEWSYVPKLDPEPEPIATGSGAVSVSFTDNAFTTPLVVTGNGSQLHLTFNNCSITTPAGQSLLDMSSAAGAHVSITGCVFSQAFHAEPEYS